VNRACTIFFKFSSIVWAVFSVGTAAAHTDFVYEILVQEKTIVWGFDFLPNGDVIFSKRNAGLFVLDPKTKKTRQISGVPEVKGENQGGLLDVRVHPDFKKNSLIYLSYSEPVGKKDATTAIAKAKLVGDKLVDFKKLFSAKNPAATGKHFGSRIEFDGAGHIFVSIGERDQRERAQKLTEHTGKILRFNEDGAIPNDNPFIGRKDAEPQIWSYGNRNPQGLAYDPVTKRLWEAEMGPRGGDEVNLIRAGANYGWPEITYGREYYGPKIGTTEKPGMEQPIAYWVPSISPSAIAVYSGDAFPEWKGNLFLACLSGQRIQRIVVDKNGKVSNQESLLEKENARFRNVRTGPDGYLWVSTDEGAIGRLKPVTQQSAATHR
jgi:glucose/arabinose dehydrogenase